ncbi:MAG: hypothetical protein JWR67_3868 [Mucilaginibacter sp.]|nr:hypothetical protein [Mucilaginibacter sp.]
MKYIVVLIFIMLSISCKKATRHNNEIIKVELARSGAWSDFGASMSIDTSLNYKYFGDYGNVKQGYFIGKVTHKFWDTLNQKFEQIKFKTIDTNDNTNVADANYFEVIIHWKNEKRRIIRVRPRENDSIINVFLWLNDSFKYIKLHPIKNHIKFETTLHIKTAISDSVKFPPPTIKELEDRQ